MRPEEDGATFYSFILRPVTCQYVRIFIDSNVGYSAIEFEYNLALDYVAPDMFNSGHVS